MAKILLIETTTRTCSAGIADNGRIVSLREDLSTDYSHSSLLTVFIEEVMHEAGLQAGDIDAAGVSEGPGSYTGLRIGVAAAKGFCYAKDIPLIAIDTMKALTATGLHHMSQIQGVTPPVAGKTLYCPMIDARRMEVYYALFDRDLNKMGKTRAEIIDENSFREEHLQDARIFFFGDGAAKCREVLTSPNMHYVPGVYPSVRGMASEAEQLFGQGKFVDLAYFEPYYLKNFVAGKPRVKGLYS